MAAKTLHVCARCKKEFEGQPHLDKRDRPFCEDCYQESVARKKAQQGQTIRQAETELSPEDRKRIYEKVKAQAKAKRKAKQISSGSWEPCPRCGSNKVQSRGAIFYIFLGISSMGCGILLLIIPFIGIPLIVIGLLIAIVSPFTFRMLQCKDCNFAWRYSVKQRGVEEKY